jgi:hypothetical protein
LREQPSVNRVEDQLGFDGLFHERQLLRRDGLDAAEIGE